jgi:sugar/nucleoside kinase (ribokinase family)
MYDIISFGDSTLDAFFELDEKEARVLCDLNRENCIICLNYADKIPVKNFTRVPAAGNAANNAVGSARLGMKAAIYTILGKDEIGEDIANVFKNEGVDSKYIIWDDVHGSNVSVVINYQGERTILVYHQPRLYGWPPELGPTKWVYYTSMGKEHYVLHEPLINYVKSNSVNLSFNPGTYQLKEGLSVLEPIMQISSVFAVNKEEARELVGDIRDMKILLSEVKKHCKGIVVITDGAEGSYATDGQKFYKLGIFSCPRVEMTGAGDAYATGFVAALFYGKDMPSAMAWGSVNAASVIQKIGPQAGLLKKDELEKILSDHPEFVGKEF